MTITSGRRPSDSIDASRSSASAPPRCLAYDVDIGLDAEKGKQPAAHDLVVVDNQDTDGFIPRRLHLRCYPFPPGRRLVRVFQTPARW